MNQQNRPSALRSTLSKLAIAGTASLAAVFVVTPVAMADEATSSEPTDESSSAAISAETGADEGTDSPATPAEGTDADAETPEEGAPPPTEQGPDATGTEAAPTQASDGEADKPVAKAAIEEEIEGDFGTQKFRVGVQIADGSVVPDGATTVGSKIQITYTDDDGESDVETCITEADTDDDPTTSYCVPDIQTESLMRGMSAKVRAAVSVEEDDGEAPEQYFYAAPGETVTLKQLTAGPGPGRTSDVATIEPCISPFGSGAPCFTGDLFDETLQPTATKVLFDNAAAQPQAKPDTASTTPGKAVTIDVLKNDDTQGQPTTDLSVADPPADGEAEVLGAPADPAARATGGGDLRIKYTPRSGFSGRDTFRYTLSTANGSSTTTVSITVKNGSTAAVSSSTTTKAAANTSSTLPDTGGPSGELLGLAALMLVGGGALTVRGRRRESVDAG